MIFKKTQKKSTDLRLHSSNSHWCQNCKWNLTWRRRFSSSIPQLRGWVGYAATNALTADRLHGPQKPTGNEGVNTCTLSKQVHNLPIYPCKEYSCISELLTESIFACIMGSTSILTALLGSTTQRQETQTHYRADNQRFICSAYLW